MSKIVGDCPGCRGIRTFGMYGYGQTISCVAALNVSRAQRFPFRAFARKFSAHQCFFSHTFRAKDRRFVEAADRIRQASALQVLATPFSSIHEDETNQWQGHEEELMKFIKETSFGHEFEPEYKVEETQLHRAFEAFISGGSSEFNFHEDDAVEEDIHAWDDYMQVDIGGYHGDVNRIRDAKNQSVEALVDAFEHRRSSTQTFDQQVSLEMEEAARQYLRAYVEYAVRLGTGDFEALFYSPLISEYIRSLLDSLPKAPLTDNLRTLGLFFNLFITIRYPIYGSPPGSMPLSRSA